MTMTSLKRHRWGQLVPKSVLAAVVALVAARAGANELENLEAKWQQPLCIVAGKGVILGEDRVSQEPHPDYPIMADDFIAGDMPLLAVRWWGSYIDDQKIREENKDTFFSMALYGSQGSHPFSLPDGPAIYTATLNPVEIFVGFDAVGDVVYRYEAMLPTPFFQVLDQEYFLSIAKHIPVDPAPWGWHDSCGSPILDFAATASTPAGPWVTYSPNTDLAFELFTAVPEPGTLALFFPAAVVILRRRSARFRRLQA